MKKGLLVVLAALSKEELLSVALVERVMTTHPDLSISDIDAAINAMLTGRPPLLARTDDGWPTRLIRTDEGRNVLRDAKTAILCSMFDHNANTAAAAMNAVNLAGEVSRFLKQSCEPEELWRLVRSMSDNVTDSGQRRPDESWLHIVGCDSTGEMSVHLTGRGLAAARREYTKQRQTDLRPREDFTTIRGEIVMAQGQGGGIALLG